MNNAEKSREQLKEACRQLDTKGIELIDFDDLGRLLARLQDEIDREDDLVAQLNLIKEDYRLRIRGMLRALVVNRPDEDDLQAAASLAGEIGDIDAGQLIQAYRRVAARFRNRFPASFKGTGLRMRCLGGGDWSEHKI